MNAALAARPLGPLGPLEELHAELRLTLPHILVAHVRQDPEHIRVTGRAEGPADIAWDDVAQEYYWSGGAPAATIGTRTELRTAIGNIAAYLDTTPRNLPEGEDQSR